MAHALAFDTLAYAKKMIAVGFTQQQAEVQAETLAEIIDEQIGTKHDLKGMEIALKRDIKEMEIALKRDIKEMEQRIIIKMGAMMAASIVIIAALVKLL